MYTNRVMNKIVNNKMNIHLVNDNTTRGGAVHAYNVYRNHIDKKVQQMVDGLVNCIESDTNKTVKVSISTWMATFLTDAFYKSIGCSRNDVLVRLDEDDNTIMTLLVSDTAFQAIQNTVKGIVELVEGIMSTESDRGDTPFDFNNTWQLPFIQASYFNKCSWSKGLLDISITGNGDNCRLSVFIDVPKLITSMEIDPEISPSVPVDDKVQVDVANEDDDAWSSY